MVERRAGAPADSEVAAHTYVRRAADPPNKFCRGSAATTMAASAARPDLSKKIGPKIFFLFFWTPLALSIRQ
jgi:hypothetical protein